MPKPKNKDQQTFNFDPPPDTAPALPLEKLEWRQDMIEQIRRDMQAYREESDPWWKEFYEERITTYRAAVQDFDKRGGI